MVLPHHMAAPHYPLYHASSLECEKSSQSWRRKEHHESMRRSKDMNPPEYASSLNISKLRGINKIEKG